jgi:hypothetical protein
MLTPYAKAIAETHEVMGRLIQLMTQCQDMKLFKNIAAVYIVWQHERHNLELESLNWKETQC